MSKLLTQLNKKIPEIKYIILLFISTRFILTIIGIFSRTLLERQYGKQYIWSQYLWLDIWGVWDTFWYMDIAEQGYSEVGRNPLSENQANYAFFPLYPLLMRLLGTVLGNRYYIAGILISNICLIISGILLYKIVNLDSNKNNAIRAVKYLFLSPVSFILSGVFTESLYLTLTLACFYFAKSNKWVVVGLSGFFLSLTRSLGVLIIIPLLYEYIKQISFQIKRVKIDVIFLLLIPLGLLIFAVYNYHLTGDFLAFANIQSAWSRNSANPLNVLIKGLQQGLFKSNMRDLIESSFSIISLSILIVFSRKINLSYIIFGFYSMLIPLATGLESMPRFILPIFPLYITIAQISKSRYFDQVITLSFAMLQGFLMVFWSCGFNLIV